MPARRIPRAFSLLELLIVIGVLTLLGGLVLAAIWRPLQQKAVLEASVTLENLSAAIEKLKEDCQWDAPLGRDDNGNPRSALLNAGDFVKELAPRSGDWANSYAPFLNSRKTAYFEVKPRQCKNGRFVDPWGNPYRYSLATQTLKSGAYEVETLASDGPDRQPGTADDIVRVVHRYPVADKNN